MISHYSAWIKASVQEALARELAHEMHSIREYRTELPIQTRD
jgi:hypothetical protein